MTVQELQVAEENALDSCREKYLAYGFIACLEKKRYGKLMEDLDNSYMLKDDKYPQTMTDAYNQILHYKMPYKPKEKRTPPTNDQDALAFAGRGRRSGTEENNTDWHRTATCYNCQRVGHIAPNCTEPDRRTANATTGQGGTPLVEGDEGFVGCHVSNADEDEVQEEVQEEEQEEYCFHNYEKLESKSNMKNWILLDNQSTPDIFCNKALLTIVNAGKESTTLISSGGELTTHTKGKLNGYSKPVWYLSLIHI